MTETGALELDSPFASDNWDGTAHGDIAWFVEARLGLFIHWGLYSLPAAHEQIQRREALSAEHYQRYFDRFDPDLFNPHDWAELAAAAGMKYFVITTKHHDGFCLWDTALTDWKATRTPCGRDLLAQTVAAFRDRGIRVGLYYSQVDWHHPHFTIDDLHVLKDAPNRAELNAGRDMDKYRAFLHGQIRELLTRFGQVDVLWFDGGNYLRSRKLPGELWEGKSGKDWDEPGLLKLIRELQPKVLINDRLGDGKLPGSIDFVCHEQALPAGGMAAGGKIVAWESPQTFSGSWGYFRDETSWKSTFQVLQMLIYTVSRGGNLLLNVGPDGRGRIERRAVTRLREIGQWMDLHSRAIHGCTAAPDDIAPPGNCALTYNPQSRRLYLHILAWPATPGQKGKSTCLYWRGLDHSRIAYAQLLNDASEVKVERTVGSKDLRGGWSQHDCRLVLPVAAPDDVLIPVVELFLA